MDIVSHLYTYVMDCTVLYDLPVTPPPLDLRKVWFSRYGTYCTLYNAKLMTRE